MAVDLTFEGFDRAEEAGWGGFAVVYRARQVAFDREVAIKVLNVRPGSDLAQELQRECTAIGSLSGHPNIVTVHGVGETPDGRPFIVMEYLHGGSLGDVVRARGPLPWKEAAEIGVHLAGALETAHLAGLIHRDVKPENVLVSRFGRPKLGDFGIARLQDSLSGGSGGATGSPRHLAPEVLDGRPPTIASDVYSLGSTLFTILAGRSPAEVADRRLDGVPGSIRDVVEQALATDPADRQASAEEVGRQLQAALAAEGSSVPELSIDTPTGLRAVRRRWPAVVAAAVATMALVVAAVALLGRDPGSDAVMEGQAAPVTTTATRVLTTTSSTTTTTTTPPPQPGTFVDDFSGPRAWARSTSPDSFISELQDGQYRLGVIIPTGALPREFPPFPAPVLATPSHMVRIEVDATKVSSTRADFGVACGGATSQFPYGGVVDTGGSWRIVRYLEGADPVELRSGRDTNLVDGPGPHRLVLECTGEGEQVTLTFTVDGVDVATVAGPRGTSYGPGPGLIVSPRVSSIEVLFDNLRISYR